MQNEILQAAQEDDRGLNVLDLKSGTILNVETANSIYQIKVLDRGEIEILGGMRSDGNFRFPSNTEAYLVGSFSPYCPVLRKGWIGCGMCMAIETDYMQVIRTSPVQNVIVEGDGWSYSMDWDK